MICLDRFRRSDGAWVSSVSGCAVSNDSSGALKADFSPALVAEDTGVQLDINASLSDSTYGAPNTVQPAAIRALALIRAF